MQVAPLLLLNPSRNCFLFCSNCSRKLYSDFTLSITFMVVAVITGTNELENKYGRDLFRSKLITLALADI